MLAKPGREGDLGQRQCGRLDQDARRLRPLRAGDGERARAEFGADQAAHLALLVAEPAGQALNAVPVDHAIGDQPHRAAHHVGPDVPLGRARGGVRAAPLAGPEACLLGRRRAAVEPHVLAFRRDRRAGRAAVDARGGHRDEEHAVKAGSLLTAAWWRCSSSRARAAMCCVMAPQCQPAPTNTGGNRTGTAARGFPRRVGSCSCKPRSRALRCRSSRSPCSRASRSSPPTANCPG